LNLFADPIWTHEHLPNDENLSLTAVVTATIFSVQIVMINFAGERQLFALAAAVV